MVEFIQRIRNEVIIDGSSPLAKRTKVEGEECVLLSAAEQRTSKFDWINTIDKIEKITIKNILIYNEFDANCLMYFVMNKKEIDLSGSDISSEAVLGLAQLFEKIVKLGGKAKEGSFLFVPILGGYSGTSRSSELEDQAKRAGFKTKYRA